MLGEGSEALRNHTAHLKGDPFPFQTSACCPSPKGKNEACSRQHQHQSQVLKKDTLYTNELSLKFPVLSSTGSFP
jgi:hypothetical protein